MIYGALNLESSSEVVGRLPLDEFFKLSLVVVLLVPLGRRRGGGGTHSGLSLVGRKKINLRAPKMEPLMQKVTVRKILRKWLRASSERLHSIRASRGHGGALR